MNQTDQDVVVQADPLRKFVRALYIRAGVPEEEAQLMADLQVETDLRGVHSHGTRMLPGYIQGILKGNMNPVPEIKVVREGPAFTVIDGGNGLGHPACAFAMKSAIRKAGTAGIAAATVCNAGHFGAAASYALMAAREGMIGFATTNTGAASVVAPGGITPVTANNAMSYALPAGNQQPIVLDMACAVSSWGKIRTMEMYGKPIPEGWLLTPEGEPTTDPRKGRVLQPASGPRGYGLALIMGILAGPLGGGLMACHKQDNPSEHFLLTIRVASFTDEEAYSTEIEKGIRTIHASKTIEGVKSVYLPGEIEWENYERWVKHGIPLHRDHLRSLEAIADELDVQVVWDR